MFGMDKFGVPLIAMMLFGKFYQINLLLFVYIKLFCLYYGLILAVSKIKCAQSSNQVRPFQEVEKM